MMPVTVALARFWESNFPNLDWYSFWYLGVPFHFLGGPIGPSLLAIFHHFFPKLSLFEIYLFLTAFFWFLTGVTLYLLVSAMGQKRSVAFLTGLIFLIGPFLPFLFPFSDGLRLINFSLLPLILLFYLGILKKWSRLRAVILALLIALSLLIDNLVLPSLLLGMMALFLAVVSWERMDKQLKRTTAILLSGFILATLWYTPSYWLHLLSTPSLAGKDLASVAILLTRLLVVAASIFLAFFSIKRFQKRKTLLFNFALFWTFIFGFLTLVRFISDWDFWQDWTNYALELQMGGSIIVAVLLNWLFQTEKLLPLVRSLLIGIMIVLLSLPWIFAPQKQLGIRENISGAVEYRLGGWLARNIRPEERVYLSGTTTFWLNSLFDIPQLRGGVDQGATHPLWGKASYEIREGKDPELVEGWLKALGVSYLVVHNPKSEEYYHDFKYPEKFQLAKGLTKVFDERGDLIYKVEGVSLARRVNLKAFQELKTPRDGADQQAVLAYARQLGSPMEIVGWDKRGGILNLQGEVGEGEGISLAITFDSGWKGSIIGQKAGLKVEKDVLGNILLAPSHSGYLNIRLYK